MNTRLIVSACASMLFALFYAGGVSAAAGEEKPDSVCIGCHIDVTPGIVTQHLDSPMANTTKEDGPVFCTDCHGDSHVEMDDFENAELPNAYTCAGKCHKTQLDQMRAGKHNLAWFGMKSQIAWHGQPGSIVRQGYKGCSGCHKIGQKGLLGVAQGKSTIEHDKGKEESQYRYGNVQCDACHTRHSFKKSEAQDPRACSNCHMGFDHPQWEMYTSSKHGIIWNIEGNKNVGQRAPTCQNCHMAKGDHAVVTPWGFLALRIPTKENVLALIKVAPALKDNLEKLAAALPSGNFIDLDDDPQWTLDRALILQAAGVLDENLQPTERFVEIVAQGRAARGPEEFNKIRAQMKKNCNQCHAKGFVDEHFKASDDIIKQSDRKYAQAISAVQALYKDGILKKPAGWKYAPDLLQYYDAKTSIEQELYLIMLEYRQRAFQGAFHASNDYMHWYGWAPLNTAVNNIIEEANRLRAEHKTAKR